MIKGLRKLNDPACFKAWAYRIATNKSIDWLKSKSKERHISLDSVEVDCNQRSVGFGAEELIQRLKDESRTVLSLYYFEQLTVSEISFALCIPAGTVKSRLHKAREELKEVWLRYCE
jgi:RNA polymerase sigma-70 factor (ECF subfamily)